MLKLKESEYKDYWEGTYLRFLDFGPINAGAKTHLYRVLNVKDNFALGIVKWFGSWRKYVFHPASMTVYDDRYLGEISEFIVARTKEHNAKHPYKEMSREKRMELYQRNRLTKEAKSGKVVNNEVVQLENGMVEGVTPLEVELGTLEIK